MAQMLDEWQFPSLFQQESEKTDSTGNVYTQGSSVQKKKNNSSTSDSGNYEELQFLDM